MEKALKTINDRDRAFINQFCVAGEFFDKDGTKTALLCKQVNAGDILEFMHRWDAVLFSKMEKPLGIEHENVELQ
jgi:hypothetical protein